MLSLLPPAFVGNSYLLIDTIDAVVNDASARERLSTVFETSVAKGYKVAAASRPLERERYFGGETAIRIPEHYSLTEFSRVVESHVREFYQLKDAATVSARVAQISSIVAGNTPVSTLAFHPLTLRMLFTVYAPLEIPREVNSTTLYLEYWNRRVSSDWRAGRPEPEPDASNLSACAAWLAEYMLASGTLRVAERDLSLSIARGDFTASQVSDLLTRSVVRRVSITSENDGVEFFHQTFFEFAAAWALTRRSDSAALEALFSHLKDNPFDSLRVPVFQYALALSQMSPQLAGRPIILGIMSEIFEHGYEQLLWPALFAVAQRARLSRDLDKSLREALADRQTAARYIKFTPSTPIARLGELWVLYRELWLNEQEENPDRNPRAIRTAVLDEMPGLVTRDRALAAPILTFVDETRLHETVSDQEMWRLTAVLMATSLTDPVRSANLLLRVCSHLNKPGPKRYRALALAAYSLCQAPGASNETLSRLRHVLSLVDDPSVRKVVSEIERRLWDERAGLPYGTKVEDRDTDPAFLGFLQSWMRSKGPSDWRDVWLAFVEKASRDGGNPALTSRWVRDLWDKLDQHPLEPTEGDFSYRAFEFLCDVVSSALHSGSDAEQFTALKVCQYCRSISLLTEIYRRTLPASPSLLSKREFQETFFPVATLIAGRLDPSDPTTARLLNQKRAREKLLEHSTTIALLCPPLVDPLAVILISLDEFHRFEALLRDGEIRVGSLPPESRELLARQIHAQLTSLDPETRHRAARLAHWSLANMSGISLDFSQLCGALASEENERTAAWLAMASLECAEESGEVAVAYSLLLKVSADGDKYVRERAFAALCKCVLEKELPIEAKEIIHVIESNTNLGRVCEAFRLASKLQALNRSVAQEIMDFLLFGSVVNGLGKTVLYSVRKQARVPLMEWLRQLGESEVEEIVGRINEPDPEIALLIADAALNPPHIAPVLRSLSDYLAQKAGDPTVMRGLGRLVRSRSADVGHFNLPQVTWTKGGAEQRPEAKLSVSPSR